MEYTFEDWLDGKPEPTNPLWKYDVKNKSLNPVYKEISEAKAHTFNWSLEVLFEGFKSDFLEKNEGLSESQKKLYTEKKIQDSEKYFTDFEIDHLIFKNHPNKFDGIDGKKYLGVKKAYEDFKIGKNKGFAYLKNDFFDAVLYFELNDFYQDFLKNGCKDSDPIISEKLKNLPHKLCILYDLGILDLIEERFSYKNHKGTAPQTDKAKLIASLFEIENPESVRQALKNNDYLSGKAKSNAVETLKKHGLEPKKLTD